MISLVFKRWHVALILYVLVVGVLVLARPSLMFQADGSPKHWGGVIDDTTSVFAPAFVIPALALLCYFAAGVIEMIAT